LENNLHTFVAQKNQQNKETKSNIVETNKEEWLYLN
jgi:hypothetical protein